MRTDMTTGEPDAGHRGMVDHPSVVHRKYVPYGDAHYAGGLVDGSYSLQMFGDLATELCITLDRDEGLFASYQDVQFIAPIYGGDIIEGRATLVAKGRRSRHFEFQCVVSARNSNTGQSSASELLDPPIVAVTARGTVVIADRAQESKVDRP